MCIGCGANSNLFTSRVAASCHNTKNRDCKGTGIKRITIETRPGDREVGGSGAGGSIPDLRHQKPGNDPNMSQKLTLVYTSVTLAGLVLH